MLTAGVSLTIVSLCQVEELPMSKERATGRRGGPWANGPTVTAGGMLVIAG